MRNSRLGCFSVTGIVMAALAMVLVAGIAYAGGNALFSPGQLSAKSSIALGGVASHAEIGECSACHTSPFSSLNMADRCAECHTAVAAEMRDPATLHGTMLMASGVMNCIVCHTDHHGLLASQTNTSMRSFPHENLGFSLASHTVREGGRAIECAGCHPTTYTAYTCDTCHTQIDAAFMQSHTAQYGKDCRACHDGKESLGKSFDHAQTSFPLTGGHLTVQCMDCHSDAKSLSALKSTPTECAGCHSKDNPHSGQLGTNCASCHTTDAWSPAKFDHNLARFKLTGRHVDVACESCHQNHVFAGTPLDCAACHATQNPHADVYGTDCASCHSTDAWNPISYDHNQTGFILDGGHITVTCEQCHGNTPASQMSGTCAACHAKDDPHGGQLGSDCASCHTTSAWKPSTFNHALSSFPLTGAHGSAACESCHPNGRFAGTPSTCGACHGKDDAHGGQLGSNCGACHTTNAWQPSTFDHSSSAFRLTGAHADTACASCHPNGQFAGTPTTCGSCHAKDDAHGGSFGKNCGACHSTTAWKPASFDHSLSSFPLTGAHKTVACSSCHSGGNFSGTSSACVSCHAEPAYHQGMFGTNCKSCHNTSSWSAKYTGPHPNTCDGPCLNHHGASCHDCHTKTLASATCTKCHDSNNPGDGGGDN